MYGAHAYRGTDITFPQHIDAVKIHAMQQHEMLEIVILTNDVTSHHWTNSSNGDDVIQTTYIHHGI